MLHINLLVFTMALKQLYSVVIFTLQLHLTVHVQGDSTNPPCYDVCNDAYNTASTKGRKAALCVINPPFLTKYITC